MTRTLLPRQRVGLSYEQTHLELMSNIGAILVTSLQCGKPIYNRHKKPIGRLTK